jgi:hypothetical protein
MAWSLAQVFRSFEGMYAYWSHIQGRRLNQETGKKQEASMAHIMSLNTEATGLSEISDLLDCTGFNSEKIILLNNL